MLYSFEVLKKGNNKQQEAFKAIDELQIMDDFAAYYPTLCGTIPIEIDVVGSDLDIIMEVHDFERFEERLMHFYGHRNEFRLKKTIIRGKQVVKANFYFMDFAFELFGQNQPVESQYAYLHMVIEESLMAKQLGLREKVIQLKEQGYKTEPAFCEVLGITGDPYENLIRFGMEKGII